MKRSATLAMCILLSILFSCCGAQEEPLTDEEHQNGSLPAGNRKKSSTSTKLEFKSDNSQKNDFIMSESQSDIMKMSGKFQSETRKIISNQKIKLDLSGATNLATIKVDSEQSIQIKDSNGDQISVKANQNILVKIGSDHQATSVISKSDPYSTDLSHNVKSVHSIGKGEFLLAGVFGQSGLVHLEPNGTSHIISGIRNIRKISANSDGNVWILSGNSLFLYHPDQFMLTRVSDENLLIHDFSATTGGSVFIGGRVRSTGARFSRFVKKDLGYIILDDETISGSTFSFGQDTYSSDTVLDYRNHRLDIRYLPISLSQSLKINHRKGQHILSDRWSLAENSKHEILAIDLGSGKIAGNPFKEKHYIHQNMGADSNMIDYEHGLAFDGTNVIKIVKEEAGIRSEFHKYLIYPENQHYKMIRMFGPAQGFQNWQGVIVHKRTGLSYWVNIQEETGEIELEDRKPLMIGSQQLTIKYQKLSAWSPGQQLVFHLFESGQHKNYLANSSTDKAIILTEITNLNENLSYALVQGDHLYFPRSDGNLGKLDGQLQTISLLHPSYTERTHCQKIKAILPGFGMDGFRILLTDSGQCGNSKRKLIIYHSPDENFQNMEKSVYEIDQINPDQVDFFTSPDASVLVNGYSHISPYKGLILSLNENAERLSDPVPFDRVSQSGLTRIQIPGHLKTELISPLGTGSMLLGLREESGYQSWTVDLATGKMAELEDLNGIQVYSFNKIFNDLFLLSGLNVSENQKVEYHLDSRGELLSRGRSQGYILQEIFPLTLNK